MKTKDRALYRQAIAKWGESLQMTMLLEEMAELQKEVCKIQRSGVFAGQLSVEESANYDYSGVVDELADVMIMLRRLAQRLAGRWQGP